MSKKSVNSLVDEVGEPGLIFVGSLAPVSSAVTLDGSGDGGVIKIAFPRTETAILSAAHAHLAGKSLVFAVWITEEEETFGNTHGGAGRGQGRKPSMEKGYEDRYEVEGSIQTEDDDES